MIFSKEKNLFIIIVGCGRFGSMVANDLSLENKNVSVIDIDNREFRKLSVSFGGFAIEGDGSDIDVLREAGVDHADILLAATNNDDINIMVAQIAKKILNVPKVIIRLKDMSKKPSYSDIGIESICPTDLSLQEFKKITS